MASIEAMLLGINDPLPEDRRVRVRITLERGLSEQINEQVQFTRLAAENLNPIIQTVTVENGAIGALDTACLVTLRGTGLLCDPDEANQGVFLQGPSGAPIKVPTAKMKTFTDAQTVFFWPTGTTANTDYTLYLKGARRGSDLVRQSNTMSGFHTA